MNLLRPGSRNQLAKVIASTPLFCQLWPELTIWGKSGDAYRFSEQIESATNSKKREISLIFHSACSFASRRELTPSLGYLYDDDIRVGASIDVQQL
jgi:hypothetical protein